MRKKLKSRNNGIYKLIGQIKQQQSDERILKAIKTLDPPTDLQTLSEVLNLHKDTIRKHLYRLKRQGKVRITRNPANKRFLAIYYVRG
ncbi:MAG: hypothetical protein DRP16_05410 [Candidatus Aenigmatarchaeota archaeon]|nr:MAG: hypothetical protein DRP16_05410 [Candidatus Aenigmarchaeota archaeon]